MPASSFPPLPEEFQRHLGVSPDLVGVVVGADSFVAFSASWRPGWPPVHESVARACAAALANDFGAPILDTFVPRALAALPTIATLSRG